MPHTILLPSKYGAVVASAVVAGSAAHVRLTGPFQIVDQPKGVQEYTGVPVDDPDSTMLIDINMGAPMERELVVTVRGDLEGHEQEYRLLHTDHLGSRVRVYRFGIDRRDLFVLTIFLFGNP